MNISDIEVGDFIELIDSIGFINYLKKEECMGDVSGDIYQGRRFRIHKISFGTLDVCDINGGIFEGEFGFFKLVKQSDKKLTEEVKQMKSRFLVSYVINLKTGSQYFGNMEFKYINFPEDLSLIRDAIIENFKGWSPDYKYVSNDVVILNIINLDKV